MMKTINLLCVHGVGHQEMDPEFLAAWSNSIRTAIQSRDR
jgi:hypothetical protein